MDSVMTDTQSASPASICGELTIFTAGATKNQLLDAIAQASAVEIAIDLSNVTEIDTAGLQLMIMAKREASRRNKCIRFTQHSDVVLDLLDLFDLTGYFGDPIFVRANS